jgi:hypothetical protein
MDDLLGLGPISLPTQQSNVQSGKIFDMDDDFQMAPPPASKKIILNDESRCIN